jgi:hypothetical protein
VKNEGSAILGLMADLLDDPWIAERVDAAVAPYVGRLSAGEIAWMRAQLAETLASDPAAGKLLRRARAAEVDESGEVRRDEAGRPVKADGAEGAPSKKKKAG